MKILYMLDSLNRGGAETLVLDVCRNSVRCGLDVSMLATGGGDLESQFESSGVPFFRMERNSAVDPGLIRNMRDLVEGEGFDLVHCQQPVEGLHALLAVRGLARRPRVILSHQIAAEADLKNRLATRYLVPRVAMNIAVSRYVLEWAYSTMPFAPKGKWQVIPNGVALSRLAPPADRSKLHQELSVPKSTPLLGMVGNFYSGKRKDQLTVCRALAEVLAAVPEAQFIFIGSTEVDGGSMYDECMNFCREAGIANRVHFLGKRNDVGELLRELDLFVFSSWAEGMPIAVIEAMAAGSPMVVSDIEPLTEVTDSGRVARLFKTGDASDLAQKILELLTDKDERKLLATSAREWAESEYTIERHIERLKGLYAQVS